MVKDSEAEMRGLDVMKVLEFIFQDFWHYAGTLILLIAICPWNNVKIRGVKKDGN